MSFLSYAYVARLLDGCQNSSLSSQGTKVPMNSNCSKGGLVGSHSGASVRTQKQSRYFGEAPMILEAKPGSVMLHD